MVKDNRLDRDGIGVNLFDSIFMIERPRRSLVKVITYRLLALIATVPFTGLSMAIGIHVMLMVIHYVHERAWARVAWGMIDSK